MYKELIDIKNKHITIISGVNDNNLHERTYTQKQILNKLKKLTKDYLTNKVSIDGDYDLEEWNNAMSYYLKLFSKLC